MVDGHRGTGSMSITQSRTSWGVELGRHRFSVTRVREARTIGGLDRPPIRVRAPVPRAPSRTPAWPIAIGAFASISAFGLFVVGAIASEPAIPRQQSRYSLSLPVPARAAAVVKALARARKPQAAAHDASAWSDLSGSRFDLGDEPYVVRAMQAGEFQEWLGSDGQRRFLSAGPEQADGDRRCRELALLVRDPNGSSRTRTARRCGPLADAGRTMAASTPASTASDVADLSPDANARPADPAYVVVGEADPAVAAGR